MQKFSSFLVLLSCVSFLLTVDYNGLPQGPYCARQNIGCCPERHDECAAEIIGTLCYCDQFCNQTRNTDCCPDYWSHCLNTPPETISTCYHDGQYYAYGKSLKVNCHECQCKNLGSRADIVCSQEECTIDPSLNNHINQRQNNYLWMASNYSEFWGIDLKDALKFKLGTFPLNKRVQQMNPIREYYDKPIPPSFDANQNWPNFITPIQNQMWCGSSWALSTIAVSNDRFAIFSKGTERIHLSAQDLISCKPKGHQGCSGGYVDRAWKRIMKFGIVSEECYPFKGTDDQCQLPKGYRKGLFYCPNGSHENKVYHVGPAYRISNETDIMVEILKNGPVQAIMKVYRDFFSYREGIYEHSIFDNSQEYGFHAVRIVGWGEDYFGGRIVKYWKVANTWGTFWGENGYFRILKGSNECDIENTVLAAWPLVDNTEDINYIDYSNRRS